jgi:predicted glycosyltransferase
MGFASSACAVTSRLFRKPSVLIDDTEHNAMNHKIYMPTCSKVLTPFYFKKDLGNKEKQIKFNAYVEQLYLHSAYYTKKEDVLKDLNVKPKEYVLIRYIAYDAHHDLKAHPLSEETKKEIVRETAKHYRVFVSLEKGVSDSFYDDYALKISPEKMHDLEANAKFMVTEGATMASEAFVLGVPYLYLNPLMCGYIYYQCNNYPDRAYRTTDNHEALANIKKLSETDCDTDAERKQVEEKTINPTDYLLSYIENYPTRK